MSADRKPLLALCCLLVAFAGFAGPAVADTATQEDDESGNGPGISVDAPDTAVYNATSTFEVSIIESTGDVTVEWTFPDGSTASTRQTSYRFQQEGNVTVTVAVTDDTGTTTRTLDYDVFRYQRGTGDSQALPMLGMIAIVTVGMFGIVGLYFKVLPWFYRNI